MAILLTIIALDIGQIFFIFLFFDNNININLEKILTILLIPEISLVKISILILFIGLLYRKLISIKCISKKTVNKLILFIILNIR